MISEQYKFAKTINKEPTDDINLEDINLTPQIDKSYLPQYIPFIEKNSTDDFVIKITKYWSKESIKYFSYDKMNELIQFKNFSHQYIIIIDNKMINNFKKYDEFFNKYYTIFNYNIPVCTFEYVEEKLITKSEIKFHPYLLVSNKLKQFIFFYDEYTPMGYGVFKLLIQSLGGSISTVLDNHISYFITFSVLTKYYSMARKFNLRILQYSFIESLLKPEHVLNDYTGAINTLLPLDNLIFFIIDLHNNKDKQLELERLIENNGGIISKSCFRYTHLIYLSNIDDADIGNYVSYEDLKSEISSHYIEETIKNDLIIDTWVKDCAKCNYFLDPLSYMIFKNSNQISIEDTSSLSIGKFCNAMKSASKSQEMTFRKPLRSYSSQQKSNNSGTISSFVYDKESMSNFSLRYALLQELNFTEQKYVSNLAYLDEFYGKAIDCQENENKLNIDSCLTLQEYKTVFQPFKDLLIFHSKFYELIVETYENYDPLTTKIGDLFIHNITNFSKYYKFLRRYGDIREIMQRLPFQTIFQKIQMERIKIPEGTEPIQPHECAFRAFQRLSGYTLILDKLIKKTSPDHIDYIQLEKAFNKMQALLDTVNERVTSHRNELMHMELVFYLDKCPPIIKSSNYPLVLHLECCSVYKNHRRNSNIHMYCFKTCIELAKFKETSNVYLSPKIGISGTKNSSNVSSKPLCTNSTKSIYKFKHIEQIWYDSIKELALIDDPKFGRFFGILYWGKNKDPLIQRGHNSITGSLMNLQNSLLLQENKTTISYRFFKCPYEINIERQINIIHNLITDCVQNDDHFSQSDYPDFVFNAQSIDECVTKWKDANTDTKKKLSINNKSLSTDMNKDANKKSPKSFNKRLSTNLSSMFSFIKSRPSTKLDSSSKIGP